MCKTDYNIGDKVVVNHVDMNEYVFAEACIHGVYAGNSFADGMEHYCGNIYTIKSWDAGGYRFKEDSGEYGFMPAWLTPLEETPVATPETVGNTKYQREIKPGVFIDVYDVLYAFAVTDPCLQHLIKKALAVGQRGHKDTRQDLVDIRDSAQRAVDEHDVWGVK